MMVSRYQASLKCCAMLVVVSKACSPVNAERNKQKQYLGLGSTVKMARFQRDTHNKANWALTPDFTFSFYLKNKSEVKQKQHGYLQNGLFGVLESELHHTAQRNSRFFHKTQRPAFYK